MLIITEVKWKISPVLSSRDSPSYIFSAQLPREASKCTMKTEYRLLYAASSLKMINPELEKMSSSRIHSTKKIPRSSSISKMMVSIGP